MAIIIEMSVQIHVTCVYNEYVWKTIAHVYDYIFDLEDLAIFVLYDWKWLHGINLITTQL